MSAAEPWLEEAPRGGGRNFVEFYQRPKQNDERTKEEGRPIFEMRDYVRIHVPGDKSSVIDRPIRDSDKQEHASQYAAFKANADQSAASGTLLSAWGGVPPERVEELAAARVRTVEQLAAVSDAHLQALGMGALQERKKAQDYIAYMKGHAPLAKLQAQLTEQANENATMRGQLLEMGKQLDSMRQAQGLPVSKAPRLEPEEVPEAVVLEAQAPKRRGRPPKVQTA